MSRTVRLGDEGYERLRLLKREGESFSDVITRVIWPVKDARGLRELSPPASGPPCDEVDRRMRAADRRRARGLGQGAPRSRRR